MLASGAIIAPVGTALVRNELADFGQEDSDEVVVLEILDDEEVEVKEAPTTVDVQSEPVTMVESTPAPQAISENPVEREAVAARVETNNRSNRIVPKPKTPKSKLPGTLKKLPNGKVVRVVYASRGGQPLPKWVANKGPKAKAKKPSSSAQNRSRKTPQKRK